MTLHAMGMLLLLPQRYIFSSKSQLFVHPLQFLIGCCCYHKGTYFQANHNCFEYGKTTKRVVVATTKVHIFKQITTYTYNTDFVSALLLLPQRYIFSSKSQRNYVRCASDKCCCCYHKGTYFQANHNCIRGTH